MMKNEFKGNIWVNPIVILVIGLVVLVFIIPIIFNVWNPGIYSANEEMNLRGECTKWISAETGPCVDKLDVPDLEGELIYPSLNETYGEAKRDDAEKFCMCPK